MGETFSSLVDLYEKSCARFADQPLFGLKKGEDWHWVSFGQFKKMVDDFRAGLAKLGVSPGDKVAVIADNRLEWAVGCYATYGLGASYVPMYQAQKADEWQFILGDCEAKVCLCANRQIFDQISAMKEALPALEHVIDLDGPESDPSSYAAVLKSGAAEPVPPRHPDSEEIAGFIYTSGTTGKPKGVKLSHGNITSNINALHEIFVFAPEDRSLSFLPWAHSFGQTVELHGMLSMGASMAINDEIPNLVGNLAVVKPTILFAVPRIFNRIYDGVNKQISERPGIIRGLFADAIRIATRRNQGESIGLVDKLKLALADKLIFTKIRQRFGGRLKYAVSGSAALSKDVAQFIDALGIEVYEGYGLTETSPIATANYPGNRKIGSVGKAIPGVRIEIDRSVTDDEVDGEIVIYGPNIMKGYHNRDDENVAVLMEDGGFRSGDMGRLDDEGYLYITGRIKEQYKLENGKYVVPSPLEEQLKLSPFIANVMIHGTNKPYNVALVVPDPDALQAWAAANGKGMDGIADDPDLKKHVEDQIAQYGASFKGYERPRKFVITLEDFTTENGLLTPTMKLKRRNVLQKYGEVLEALYES